jgi:hypothetical protein
VSHKYLQELVHLQGGGRVWYNRDTSQFLSFSGHWQTAHVKVEQFGYSPAGDPIGILEFLEVFKKDRSEFRPLQILALSLL